MTGLHQQPQTRPGRPTALLVDLASTHGKFIRAVLGSVPVIPPLQLPQRQLTPSGNLSDREFHSLLGNHPSIDVVFGYLNDPFRDFEESFRAAKTVLEILSERHTGRIYLRTRSPLLVLAAPALRALHPRLNVTVAFETFRDEMSIALFPGMPLPSERARLARALYALGFSVGLQLTPTFRAAQGEKEFADWLFALRMFIRAIKIYEPVDVLPQRTLQRLSNIRGLASLEEAAFIIETALTKMQEFEEPANHKTAA